MSDRGLLATDHLEDEHVAFRRIAASDAGRIRHGRRPVPRLGRADEGEARAPRPAVRALEIVDAARALCEGNRLVFPMRSGRPIGMSTLPKMLQNHRIPAVPHGFRSSFRDWAAEETDHPREVIEAALAHVVQNKVEAAIARCDLFELRRQLMADWEVYPSR